MFVQTLSRPDISYAVNSAAKFTSYPQCAHYIAINRIFRYLVGTLDLAIYYDGNKDTNTLATYVDADYAGDITDRESRTNTLVLLNDALVAWCNHKQAYVATSTTEAKYIVASSTTKDVIWLRRLLQNLRFFQPHLIGLFSDNQSAIRLVHNPEFHRHTKHIDIIYHFIREHQLLGNIDVYYIPTTEQLADLLTKALLADRFKLLRDAIGLTCLPATTTVVDPVST
jgi:hypothetical protein